MRSREAGDAGRVVARHLGLLQHTLQQQPRFGAPGAPPGTEVEGIEERVECKTPDHEGDLIEADILELRRELRKRPARQDHGHRDHAAAGCRRDPSSAYIRRGFRGCAPGKHGDEYLPRQEHGHHAATPPSIC